MEPRWKDVPFKTEARYAQKALARVLILDTCVVLREVWFMTVLAHSFESSSLGTTDSAWFEKGSPSQTWHFIPIPEVVVRLQGPGKHNLHRYEALFPSIRSAGTVQFHAMAVPGQVLAQMTLYEVNTATLCISCAVRCSPSHFDLNPNSTDSPRFLDATINPYPNSLFDLNPPLSV